ncbi:hypothetical protein HAX54_025952 [Datura stramonium]|uniref:Uncharacterized protein n=1 Tax=Datura stramonium TaxID=4076 RepID=A0ABS8V0Q7_DATST|nr:hypothetical protein [Datura stramonium]
MASSNDTVLDKNLQPRNALVDDPLLRQHLGFLEDNVSSHTGRKGARREEECTMREARRSTSLNAAWILAVADLDSHVDPNEYPFHGGKSLAARQEESKFQILSR